MTAEGNSMGGLTVGFESMISTVLPGSPVDLNANTSVRSSRVSSPGNLRLSALKWLDIVAPLGSEDWFGGEDRRYGGRGSGAQDVEQGGVDLVGVRPGDSVRAALDHDEVNVLDQARQAAGRLVQRQHLVRVAVDDQHGHV